MKNILLWAGIAVLAFQDYFKKPVKPTRSQQFFQTGGTSQAFVEGYSNISKNTFAAYKKMLSYYFGKPEKGVIKVTDKKNSIYFHWNIKGIIIELYKVHKEYDIMVITYLNGYSDKFYLIREQIENNFAEVVESLFEELKRTQKNKDYQKLYDIAAVGDWELALEIAKGQGLI